MLNKKLINNYSWNGILMLTCCYIFFEETISDKWPEVVGMVSTSNNLANFKIVSIASNAKISKQFDQKLKFLFSVFFNYRPMKIFYVFIYFSIYAGL